MVVRGRGPRGGVLRDGRGPAVRGEGAGDLVGVLWLVLWRGGCRRSLLWRWPAVEAVRGRGMGEQRRGALAGDSERLSAGEIGELDTPHQVRGEPLHDFRWQPMGVCDDVGQVRGEAGGGGRGAIVLARLQRLRGTRLRWGEVGAGLLLLLPLLLLAVPLRGSRGLLLLLLRGWRRLLVIAGGGPGGGRSISALGRVGGGSVRAQGGRRLLRGRVGVAGDGRAGGVGRAVGRVLRVLRVWVRVLRVRRRLLLLVLLVLLLLVLGGVERRGRGRRLGIVVAGHDAAFRSDGRGAGKQQRGRVGECGQTEKRREGGEREGGRGKREREKGAGGEGGGESRERERERAKNKII